MSILEGSTVLRISDVQPASLVLYAFFLQSANTAQHNGQSRSEGPLFNGMLADFTTMNCMIPWLKALYAFKFTGRE